MAILSPVRLNDDLKERVRQLAKSRRCCIHDILREAVTQYFEREEKREAYHRDVLQVWQVYRESGSHLTGAEADSWLTRLASGDDGELPECHR